MAGIIVKSDWIQEEKGWFIPEVKAKYKLTRCRVLNATHPPEPCECYIEGVKKVITEIKSDWNPLTEAR